MHERSGQWPNFNYHPRFQKLDIVNLFFADDLLMFTRGNVTSVKLLHEKFKKFSEATGLKANLGKSQVYFGGVCNEVKLEILELLSYEEGSLPVRYLGVPLCTKRLTVTQCRPVIDKMTCKISCWTSRLLTYAGRLQLVKAVLHGIQAYWAQIFVLPKKVIDRMCTSFLWGGSAVITNKALIAWEKFACPKVQEG